MSRYWLWMLVVVTGVASTLVSVETAEAQVFGRRWQRRKAEIKGELSTQLTAKVNADIQREMDVATNKINSATQEQLAAEIVKLREQASQLVAAEGEKLKAQAANQLKELQSASEAALAAHTKKLEEQAAAQVKDLAAKLDAKLVDESKKLHAAYAEQVKVMQTGTAEQIKALTSSMQGDLAKLAKTEAERVKDALAVELKSTVESHIKDAQAASTPAAPAEESAPEKPQEIVAPATSSSSGKDEQSEAGEE